MRVPNELSLQYIYMYKKNTIPGAEYHPGPKILWRAECHTLRLSSLKLENL
jgi:hypothetical protein